VEKQRLLFLRRRPFIGEKSSERQAGGEVEKGAGRRVMRAGRGVAVGYRQAVREEACPFPFLLLPARVAASRAFVLCS